MYEDLNLKGKVALVTGGAKGIGKAVCLAFADAGVDVAVNTRKNVELAEEVAGELRLKGGRAKVYRADVADRNAVFNMTDDVVGDFGRIDILVTCAGVAGLMGASLEQLDAEEWLHVMDVNVNGMFFCSQAVGRHMLKRRSGSVINISSTAGIRPIPLRGAYSVSRAAAIMLTRQLAMEWGASNVRVNCIAPGHIATPRTSRAIADQELHERRMPGIPLRRPGRPEEIANMTLFLASDRCAYMTGQTMVIDGGENEYWPEMVARIRVLGEQNLIPKD